MSKINLRCGDAREVLRSMPDESIDLIVTDPPYKTISGGTNSKWKSGWKVSVLYKNDGKIFDKNNIEFEEWLPDVYRVLKPNSHFYCMTNVINMKKLMIECEKVGFILHNILVWEKNTATANRWYMKNCEFTLFFRKGKAKTINVPSSKQVHQFDNIVGTKLHPTQKPVELMKLYVKNSSNPNDVVLDPFMGCGSTGIACKQLNRNFIGIEEDSNFFDVAKKLLEIEETTTQDDNQSEFERVNLLEEDT